MTYPFKKIKVIELASVLAGPTVGQFFAELGAEVIKIENPKTNGDITRSWKLKSEDKNENTSAYYSCANWGKTSIFSDISNKSELQKLYALIQSADIVISSYKPGDDKKLKVDYITLKKLNPRLIYASVSGYGEDDSRAGFDAIIQAEAGFMYMNGSADGLPTKMPVALIDLMAAHQLKEGVLVALLNREKTGKGSKVSVSLFEAAVSSLANQATNWLVAGEIPQRIGSEHPNIAPYGTVFKCKNGAEIVLAIGTDKQFIELCKVLKIDISDNKKFKTNADRVKNRIELNTILKLEIAKQNRDALLKKLHQKFIPAGAINNMKEVFQSEKAKKMILKKNKAIGLKTIAFKWR